MSIFHKNMVEVRLAGFNIDINSLESLLNQYFRKGEEDINPHEIIPKLLSELTPETISAAYARISRSTKPLKYLREEAANDIKSSRDSNENIVYGYGHSSIAEHSVFNFDITEVSRLAVETIEERRLGSFTEKSQRYVKIGESFMIPNEILNAPLKEDFLRIINADFELYSRLFDKLKPYFLERYSAKDEKIPLNYAKEDARYILPLCTTTQVGMTMNARTLVHLIKRLREKGFGELEETALALETQAKEVAPSLIKRAFDINTIKKIQTNILEIAKDIPSGIKYNSPVNLIDYPEDDSAEIIAGLLFSNSNGDYKSLLDLVKTHPSKDKENLLKKAVFQHLSKYDSLPRGFELGDFTYQLIVSSSCYAQLKRHRICTLLPQNYDFDLGAEIPDSIKKIGMEHQFLEQINKRREVYQRMENIKPGLGAYCLTNANQRRVFLKINTRSLYHFSRLREDEYSQWSIRGIANEMLMQAKKVAPITMLLSGGKDKFDEIKKELFNN